MDLKLLQALGTALFIGALVGTERTKHQKSEQEGFAGLRTFILFAELGAVLGWLSVKLSSAMLFTAGLVCVTVVVAAAYLVEKRASTDSVGTTTTISALIVYVLGGLSMTGYSTLAVALGIATAALLAMKETLHQGVQRINQVELFATLRLLFASFIVLPLLPRHPVDPWGVINPYKLWLLVILISALSMVGYVAVRLLGAARGVLVTGFFGGIVSSTAATLTFARQSRENPNSGAALVAGTLISWTVMFLRIAVLVAVLRWSLLRSVILPIVLLGILGSGFCFWALRRAHGGVGSRATLPQEATFRNPFKLVSAVKFALIFAVILLAAKLVTRFAPGAGIYWLSAIAGTTDVDAIVLSLADLGGNHAQSNLVLARAILIAIVANTLGKFGLAAFLGTRQLRVLLIPAAAAMVATGMLMIWYVR